MSSMLATVWVDESDDSNKMEVTIAIEGQETEIYLMDRNLWESIEQGILNGRFLTRWMSKPEQKSKTTSAKGSVNNRELDVTS